MDGGMEKGEDEEGKKKVEEEKEREGGGVENGRSHGNAIGRKSWLVHSLIRRDPTSFIDVVFLQLLVTFQRHQISVLLPILRVHVMSVKAVWYLVYKIASSMYNCNQA